MSVRNSVGNSTKTVAVWIRDAWLMLGAALLLLIVIECVASLSLRAHARYSQAQWKEILWMDADDLRGVAWGSQLYREFSRIPMHWEPYVYWRRDAHAGEHINIDDRGLRRTVVDGSIAPGAGPSLRIFFFGGSTMWGTGARDGHTIPSLVASSLRKHGIASDAVNFGESGYVSTQSLLKLMAELREGRVPDLVIFYDGINDTYSTWQNQSAGLPQNERNRVKEFNLTLPVHHPHLYQTAVIEWLKKLNTYAVVVKVARRLGVQGGNQEKPFAPPVASEGARHTVALYRENLRLLAALGNFYGFEALCYWQPVIYGKKSLTPHEEYFHGKHLPAELRSFFDETYRLIDGQTWDLGPSVQFRNLAGIFAEASEPMFVDWAHLSERGNARIADRMIGDIVAAHGRWFLRFTADFYEAGNHPRHH